MAREFLKSQIEVGTGVCRTDRATRGASSPQLRAHGRDGGAARRHGLAPIAASTHPFAAWQRSSRPTATATSLAEDSPASARRLVICGMHVHVGIEDDELRIDLMNQARYFLPHLLVLSHLLAVLAGRGHRPQVLPPRRLSASCRAPACPSASRAGASGSDRRAAGARDRGDRGRQQDLVGPAPLGPLSDAGDAHHRRLHAARGRADASPRCTGASCACSVAAARANQTWRTYPLFLLGGEPLARPALRRRRHAVRFRQGRAGALRATWSTS